MSNTNFQKPRSDSIREPLGNQASGNLATDSWVIVEKDLTDKIPQQSHSDSPSPEPPSHMSQRIYLGRAKGSSLPDKYSLSSPDHMY